MNRSERITVPEGVNDDLTSRETSPPALKAVPRVLLSPEDILRLALDHREGFLLSLIDGQTNVEHLLELASMPRKEVLRLLARWMATGVIAVK